MMFTAGFEEQAVADTSRAAAHSGGAGGEIFGELLKHVRDSHELDTPFGGLIHISSAPLRDTLALLGQ